MPLFIQDPLDPSARSLHEVILEACSRGISGGGAFAFVSREGARLLLRDDDFVTFIRNNEFNMVVGLDEVTNPLALQELDTFSQEFSNFSVRAFKHNNNGATFHPKFCWFRYNNGGVLITGSGNLTIGGLRGNWEAFTITELTPENLEQVENTWEHWNNLNQPFLFPPDDESVIEQARGNIWTRRRTRPTTGETNQDEDDAVPPPVEIATVLVAEIPRASSRWNQANFDMNNFENFFGMRIGDPSLRALLQHIDDDGSLGQIEIRPGVSVRSQNYRLELNAASGLSYPSTGRPIGIFIRVAARTFRYRLLMPGDLDYNSIDDFLDEEWSGPSNRVRRIITDTESLRNIIPDSIIWDSN